MTRTNQPEQLTAADRARFAFRRRFGADPARVASAPGRVNLIGEHVDYTEGIVLPFAIDPRAAIAIGPGADHRSLFVAEDLAVTVEYPGPPITIPDPSPDHRFANHLLGVLHAAGGSDGRPLNLLVASDIPIGAGLSSSAAVEVALGAALAAFLDRPTDPHTLARQAQIAEHEFVGTPCGIMDMLISAAGIAGHALRIDCRDLRVTPVTMPAPEEAVVLIVDSGVTHRLSDGGYADRRASCEHVQSILEGSLRDATLESISDAGLSDRDRKRATHVIEENARVDAAVTALQAGNLPELGKILFDGHRSLRELFEVSIPELDFIVDTAAELGGDGCFGARMTGGGFGGSAILLVATTAVETVRRTVERRFAAAYGRTPTSMTVRACQGVRLES
ncbi:MAG: galactokinase [Phycisphaerales bacterium]|jgi:galactokinase|nr:galactokinase [Phycisphaerales bacterium]